jgi:Cysteine-rich secretory protein family
VFKANGSCSVKNVELKVRTRRVVGGRVLGFLVLLLGLQVLGVSKARADIFSDESRFVQRINADRISSGLAPLNTVPRLVEIARSWSRVLGDRSTSASECALSHSQNLLDLLRPASKVGENVGCGDANADALHEAFMNSTHHRNNILDPSFDSVGVGVVYVGPTMFVTVEFVRTVPASLPVVSTIPVPLVLPALAPVPKAVPNDALVQEPTIASRPLPANAVPGLKSARKPSGKVSPKAPAKTGSKTASLPKTLVKPVAKSSVGAISKRERMTRVLSAISRFGASARPRRTAS